ncbi:hypothetical protein J32TS6_19200 [Virgibacillus pantothenticus]|uniref:tail completion protein gp17 n=1 Tax=Virgibacillus pantothenticus TaxID=1473 RepID=UPI001B1D4F4F|nr:DUF3168 domain-containing protein [Virgibacillus pantothenticus]GIP63365.1 hypothetical protein J32TS6_19200 [Virgibacillus pantothenticus]
MDVLDKVYEALITDDYIKEQAQGRIKFYEYPATGDVNRPYIVIDPLQAPTPSDYGDNKWTKLDYLLQIDVWTRNRKTTDSIADRVRDIMWNTFGFHQITGPKEYDEGVFRDARRYRGTLYRNDLDSL